MYRIAKTEHFEIYWYSLSNGYVRQQKNTHGENNFFFATLLPYMQNDFFFFVAKLRKNESFLHLLFFVFYRKCIKRRYTNTHGTNIEHIDKSVYFDTTLYSDINNVMFSAMWCKDKHAHFYKISNSGSETPPSEVYVRGEKGEWTIFHFKDLPKKKTIIKFQSHIKSCNLKYIILPFAFFGAALSFWK